MAFITSGAVTVARVVSTYATNMAAEQDIWSMIKNIAANFFKALNQALNEKGYTLGGAALWGGTIIVITVAVSYGLYKIYRWKVPLPDNSKNSESKDPARVPLELLNNAFEDPATRSEPDLEEKLAAVTGSKDFDLTKRSPAEQKLIKDVKAQIIAIKVTKEQNAKKTAVDNTKKTLGDQINSGTIAQIQAARSAYTKACINDNNRSPDQTRLEDADQRINELNQALREDDLKAANKTSVNDLVTRLCQFKIAFNGNFPENAQKLITDTETIITDLIKPDIEKLKDENTTIEDLEMSIKNCQLAKKIIILSTDANVAIKAATQKIAVSEFNEKRDELMAGINDENANPHTVEDLFVEYKELKIVADIDDDNMPAKRILELYANQIAQYASIKPAELDINKMKAAERNYITFADVEKLDVDQGVITQAIEIKDTFHQDRIKAFKANLSLEENQNEADRATTLHNAYVADLGEKASLTVLQSLIGAIAVATPKRGQQQETEAST